ncbi:receptor for retinol uptake stra6-like [Mytilus edulis]|uniref:receptor for retinol uptake stra6-like n=1 Tax=Mytilus edulis TaxID=6550 RepID=UPI0039EF5ECD
MSLSILSVLLESAINSTEYNTSTQVSNIDCDPKELTQEGQYLFYQLMLIPSILEFVFFSFMVTRKNKFLDKCASRPGIVYPMNIFEMKNRMSFIAAFGAISYLCSEVILNGRFIFEFNGHFSLRIFVILVSVICYGLIFFPVFGALTVRTPLGYILGTLHVWVFFFEASFITFGCSDLLSSTNQFLLVLRDWPKLASMFYLAVMLPARFLFSLNIIPHIPIINPKPNTVGPHADTMDKIRSSLAGKHVRNTFQPPRTIIEDHGDGEGCKDNMISCFSSCLKPWLYRNNPNFRYSARILSVYFVCFVLIYKISVELIIFFLPTIKGWVETISSVVDVIGTAEDVFDSEDVKTARKIVLFLYYTIEGIQICFIFAITAEVMLSALIIFHMISSYRKNLLSLFKGSTHHIPPRSSMSNASLMVGTMRYTGYQIGYILWAYIVQAALFFWTFFVIDIVVSLYRAGLGGTMTDLISEFWSIPVTAILLSVLQLVMAKFLFLQESGNVLAIENRRGFFLAVYFVFFYNTFLGLVSCLLRIIKATVIGILFLGRLDHSTLPRRFQLFDPGFNAYVGFMHIENAHYNPVILTFLSLIQVNLETDKDNDEERELKHVKEQQRSRRHRVASINWYLACLLHYNPHLRVLRKDYLETLRAKREITVKSKDAIKIYDEPEISVGIEDLKKSSPKV